MKITDDQLKILESFKCERLSTNNIYSEKIKTFKSARGSQLVSYLQELGWKEDQSNETAFYLIIGPDGDPWVFFSMKCGALFQVLDEKKLFLEYKEIDNFLRKQNENSISEVERNKKLEYMRRRANMLNRLNEDKNKESGRPILRVSSTLPGIDIVHFCANDDKKNKWSEFGFTKSMGQTLFFHSIVQKLIDIQKHVGCQYAYLFAADSSEDESLVNYYRQSLKFDRPKEFGTNKPYYDLLCTFMAQHIDILKEQRTEFFNNFNPDAEDIIA